MNEKENVSELFCCNFTFWHTGSCNCDCKVLVNDCGNFYNDRLQHQKWQNSIVISYGRDASLQWTTWKLFCVSNTLSRSSSIKVPVSDSLGIITARTVLHDFFWLHKFLLWCFKMTIESNLGCRILVATLQLCLIFFTTQMRRICTIVWILMAKSYYFEAMISKSNGQVV